MVNADDFGLAEHINNGIIECSRNGIVTSTSIMANGEAFEHAVYLSMSNPTLAVGIHLVLVEEKPIFASEEISSLLSADGKFHKNYRKFVLQFLSGRIDRREIENEFRAQIEKVLQAGIQVTHIDSHQHLHIFPPILEIVLRLAKEYDIKWIRNAKDSAMPTSLGQFGLSVLAKTGKRKILRNQMNTSDYFWGAGFSGRLTEQIMLIILSKLPNGISEIMCHPGESNNTPGYNHWQYNWQQEEDALMSRSVKQRVEKQGITLLSYADLQ